MRRVVLDANVLISGLLSPTGPPAQVLDLWRAQRFVLLTSKAILAEFVRAAAAPRLQRYGMTEAAIIRLVRSLRQFAVFTTGHPRVRGVARDPHDDKCLACAVAGNAEYLVSGDADLTSLESFRGVRIASPAAFVQLMQEEGG